jgi:hypothetical protein
MRMGLIQLVFLAASGDAEIIFRRHAHAGFLLLCMGLFCGNRVLIPRASQEPGLEP